MGNTLRIGPKEKRALERLADYADRNRIDENLLQKCAAREYVVGDNPDYVAHIEYGFRIVLSIEEQPIGWCRHLSITKDEDVAPHPLVVEEIMKELGFKGGVHDCDNVWLEPGVILPTGEERHAVNLIQRIDD